MPTIFSTFLLIVKKKKGMCCILGTDGILHLPENKALMTFAC